VSYSPSRVARSARARAFSSEAEAPGTCAAMNASAARTTATVEETLFIRTSLQNLPGLHRPEDEVEFVEVYPNLACKVAQATLGREVAGAGRGRLRRVEDADL